MTDSHEREWKWCAGILLGFGECAFQYSHNEIRRVTKLIPQDGGGIGLIKVLMGGIMKGFEIIPAEGLIIYFAQVNNEVSSACERFWGSILLQPGNGRLRLDK